MKGKHIFCFQELLVMTCFFFLSRYHRGDWLGGEGKLAWRADGCVGGERQGREVSRCFQWRGHPQAGREEKVQLMVGKTPGRLTRVQQGNL